MVARGWGGGNTEQLFNGYKIPFGETKIFRNKTDVVVAQYYECFNATELFTLKWPILCSMNFTSIKQKSRHNRILTAWFHFRKGFTLQFSMREQIENHNHKNLTNLITWTTAFLNSTKLWAVPCRATQDGRVMVERSDKMWSTGEGNGKPLQYSCLENPMNSMKRQNNRIMKEELPRSVGAQYATGDQWRNNSRKNEEMGAKAKTHSTVDVTGDGSKVQWYKEQYCIGTCDVRSMKSRQSGSGQTGDGKSEYWHFRNQWTKMDWNGWI